MASSICLLAHSVGNNYLSFFLEGCVAIWEVNISKSALVPLGGAPSFML